MLRLSVIIPLYNEEQAIDRLFDALHEVMRDPAFASVEYILVNDGSTDRTEELLREHAHSMNEVSVLSIPRHAGKGAAVRHGMLAAQGDWRLCIDADLSVSLTQAAKLLARAAKGYDVVIGSRARADSHIAVPQGMLRRACGKAFTLLANTVLGLNVSDVTCGCKCFSARAAEALFGSSVVDGWSYDAEILSLARRAGMQIGEVGVEWANGSETRVRLPRDAVVSVCDIARIRLLHSPRRHGS